MPFALIVSHGQPSEPEPAEADVAALAALVARHLPGWLVRSATLAKAGALARALDGADSVARVYPLFMADGWFTQTHLPLRLKEAGAGEVIQLAPFGVDPAVQALTVTLALEAAARAGREPGATEVLSGRARVVPQRCARRRGAERRAGFWRGRAGSGGSSLPSSIRSRRSPRWRHVLRRGHCACRSSRRGAGM